MDKRTQAEVARILGCDDGELEGVIDEIDGAIELYRFNKAEIAAMPTRGERRKQLMRFDAALAVLLERLPTPESVFAGTEEYDTLLRMADVHQKIARQMLAEKSARGRDPDDRYWLIGKLAEIFCRLTGEKITITYSDSDDGGYRGRFYDFAWTVLSANDFTDVALGGAIREWHRKERRGKNK